MITRILITVVIALSGCRVKNPPAIEESWQDDFERSSIGRDYYRTGSGYKIIDGTLRAEGAHNHPLWLRRVLPRDVIIEFDTWSNSKEGDIKVEVFGDGKSYDPDGGRYLATSYVFLFGGWNNSLSAIARQDEHDPQKMAQKRAPKVKQGKKYHWKIVRHGKTVEWFVDDMDTPYLKYEDNAPLAGPGHQYFGFNNWESETYFDNLKIQKYPSE